MGRMLLILVLLTSVLTACGGGTNTEEEIENARAVVQNYLQAKADSDETGIRANICSAMEADVERETYSFAGMNTVVEGLSCTVDLDTSTVACQGYFTVQYGGGDTSEFPLATYNIVKEDDVWKWCGEQTES
jgi:hypothetical protein